MGASSVLNSDDWRSRHGDSRKWSKILRRYHDVPATKPVMRLLRSALTATTGPQWHSYTVRTKAWRKKKKSERRRPTRQGWISPLLQVLLRPVGVSPFFRFFSLSSSYSPFRLYFSPLSKKSSYFNRLKNGHRRWPTESRTFSSQMLFKNRFNRIKSLCKCRLVWTDCSRLFCYRNSWLIISRTGSFWWSDLIT